MKKIFLLTLTFISFCFAKAIAQQYTFAGEISEASVHPDGNSLTKYLTDLTVDENGLIYVLDGGLSNVKVFSENGVFIKKWGTPGSIDNQLLNPCALTYDSLTGSILIADTGNNRIMVFDKDGNFKTKWGSLGTGDNQFNSPIDIVLDMYGYIYVADSGNNCIKKFTADGTFLWTFRKKGLKPFKDISSIAINKTGTQLVVCDKYNNRIHYFRHLKKIFSIQIAPVRKDPYWAFRRGMEFDDSNNLIVSDFLEGNIYKYGVDGKRKQKIHTAPRTWTSEDPQRLTLGKNNKIYSLNATSVTIFSSEGNRLLDFQVGLNYLLNLFKEPTHLDFDANGYIYVRDLNSIKKINPDRTLNKSFDNIGSPGGIAVDKNNNVYVKSPGKILKYTSDGDYITQWPVSSNNYDIQFDKTGNLLIDDFPDRTKLHAYSPTGDLLYDLSLNSHTGYGVENFVIDSLNNFYVLDLSGCIIKYSSSGTELNSWCDPADLGLDNMATYSNAISIDDSGYVYVVYSNSNYFLPVPYHQVCKFNGDMELKAQFGDGPAFKYIRNLAVDKNGIVYIPDWQNKRILMYAPDYTAPTIPQRKATSEESTDTYLNTDSYQVYVYPNPSTGNFTIATADDDIIQHITLTNLSGQQEVFYTKNITTSMKGLLLLDIKSSKGRSTHKIIVE